MERKRRNIFIGSLIIIFLLSNNVFASSFNIGSLAKNYVFLGLILFLGFLGLLIEIFNDRFGLGLILSLFSFSAFFMLNYPTFSGNTYIPHFIFGLILIVIEIVIPGFAIVGLIGTVLISVSIVLTVPNVTYGILMLLIALGLNVGILSYLIKKGYSSKFLDRLILRETNHPQREGDETSYIDTEYQKYRGKEGIVLSDMRPSGMIEIDGEKIDALSEGTYIKKGESVEVIKVEGNKITVRRA